jgi:hypothetical protein
MSESIENLKANWKGILIGLFFLGLGILSLVFPDTFDEVKLRRGGIIKLIVYLWGWPVGIASTLFGVLILWGCTKEQTED